MAANLPSTESPSMPVTSTAPKRILITGSAGFIGFSLARRLLADGHIVCGIDGMTAYYDVALKQRRLDILRASNRYVAHQFMLEDFDALSRAAEDFQPDIIIHLAAQAGVRYSLENPRAYVDSNLIGTFNVMEIAKAQKPAHFMLASTSSIYGANTQMPFGENDRADHPMTFYAATKKSTELMAHSYAHLWDIPTTAFRFFTVYGPWGRPDMALFKFVEAMMQGQPIDIYNNGEMSRDFTYIDDLVEGIVRLMDCAPVKGQPVAGGMDSLSPVAPFRVVNLGGGQPVKLMRFIECIEQAMGQTALKNMMPMQAGDVPATFARTDLLEQLIGYKPQTPVEVGVKHFVEWYRDYHKSA
jgi:UDP-glucuronate 4-epimerase